jgi:glutamate--cysteine ligase regulatory subunit
MSLENVKNYSNIIISTGNILNEFKTTGQKPQEELINCIKSTLSNQVQTELSPKSLKITRSNDDLLEKIQEHDRQSVKIGVKVFLSKNCPTYMAKAIDNILETLNVEYLDNLILAYHPMYHDLATKQQNGDASSQNGETHGINTAMKDLIGLWETLEKYSLNKKIEHLGIADLDYSSLKTLFAETKVRPTIAQINLSTCCVVPPELQEFCSKNDVQLLTHSDPEDILPNSSIEGELNIGTHYTSTITRYQVHIKCRGLLTAKGFIVNIDKKGC